MLKSTLWECCVLNRNKYTNNWEFDMHKMPSRWASYVHNQRVKKMKRRLLRKYRRLAFKDHGGCWRCRFDIYAGDEYEAEVWAVTNPPWLQGRRSIIEVMKTHINCPDDPWEEVDRREMEEGRNNPAVVDKVA